jgi:hypothetical protein
MQYDNKHLLDFGIVIGIKWLKLEDNRNINNGDQNRNDGVWKILMLFCFCNRTQRELNHVDLTGMTYVTLCLTCELTHR